MPVCFACRRQLPADITVRDLEDYLEELEAFEERPSTAVGFRAADLPGNPVDQWRLGIFLPGGGALVGRTIVLIASDGSALQVAVDSWTARPLIGPVLRPEPDAFEDSDEDPVDEDEDAVLDPLDDPEPEPVVDPSSIPTFEPDDPTGESAS